LSHSFCCRTHRYGDRLRPRASSCSRLPPLPPSLWIPAWTPVRSHATCPDLVAHPVPVRLVLLVYLDLDLTARFQLRRGPARKLRLYRINITDLTIVGLLRRLPLTRAIAVNNTRCPFCLRTKRQLVCKLRVPESLRSNNGVHVTIDCLELRGLRFSTIPRLVLA
jgi:hypothetical protein